MILQSLHLRVKEEAEIGRGGGFISFPSGEEREKYFFRAGGKDNVEVRSRRNGTLEVIEVFYSPPLGTEQARTKLKGSSLGLATQRSQIRSALLWSAQFCPFPLTYTFE